MGEEGVDLLECLGPDTSAIVFTLLRHPADLARASAVSRSWRTFVIGNQLSKMLCLRVCPEISSFTSIQESSEDIGSSGAAAEWENLMRHHRVYLYLTHGLLSPYNTKKDCIDRCIGASSTDNFPEETIENTLDPMDRVGMRPSYWSSGGQSDPNVPEFLLYSLHSDLCLVDEIKIHPFKAFFQYGNPVYSAQNVRFQVGCPKSPLRPELDEQLTTDDNYIWTYTSPEFPMLKENVLQSFKLPRAILCIGGVVKVELLGRVQKQAMDGLYYICMTHIQILGSPLSRELAVATCENGIVLKYHPNNCDLSGGNPSRWHDFARRIWRRGIWFHQTLLFDW